MSRPRPTQARRTALSVSKTSGLGQKQPSRPARGRSHPRSPSLGDRQRASQRRTGVGNFREQVWGTPASLDIAGTHQVANGLERGRGDVDRLEQAAREQTRERARVPRVGLDPIPRPLRYEPGSDHLAGDSRATR
jgi:hypothetical protein